MTVKPLLIGAFEAALNRYVAMDSDAGLLLAPLSGKIVAVTLRPFNVTLYCCPADDSIQILEDYVGSTDAALTGSISAFGAKGMRGAMRELFDDEIEIDGDVDVGRAFLEVFEKLDIDFEEQFSHYTGDIVAHRIGHFFRVGARWTAELLETARLNTKEFLQEEARDLPAVPEVDMFYRKTDALQTDTDQLQSRIEKLENFLRHTESAR
ncbi:MAG: SCP2 sterol-binding domain-containing protein [Methylomicrobium sp.]